MKYSVVITAAVRSVIAHNPVCASVLQEDLRPDIMTVRNNYSVKSLRVARGDERIRRNCWSTSSIGSDRRNGNPLFPR